MIRVRDHLREMAGGLPSAFWWLFAGSIVNRLTGFIVPFLALWLTRERGVSPALAGGAAALYGAGAVVSTLTGGVLADRIGRRTTMLCGLCGNAAAVLALAPARDLALLAALVLVAGFFGELFRPALLACIADLVPPEDRDRAYGLSYWGVNLGWAVGGAVSGLLAEASYTLLFVADATTTLAFAAMIAARVPETRAAGAPGALRDSIAGLAAAFADRPYRAFLALQLALFLVFIQIQTSLPLDMASKGLGPSRFGAVITTNGILIGLVQPFAPAFLRRFDRARVLAGAAVLVGVGFGLHALASGVPGYLLAIALWTLGEIAWLPTASALVADLSPPHLRGRYQGAYTMTIALSAFAAPLFGPALLARAGGGAFWGGCLAVGIAVSAGQLALAGARRRESTLRAGSP